MKRIASIVSIAACALSLACNDGSLAGNPTPTPDESPTPTPVPGGTWIAGTWSGTAVVPAGQFLEAGTYPVTVVITQEGDQIRGIIDIEENLAALAEFLGYFFRGTVSESGIEIEMTDRICAAGDPDGLCYPGGSVQEKIFTAGGTLDGETGISFGAAAVAGSPSYSPDLPFTSLQVTYDDVAHDPRSTEIEGSWDGYCRLPNSMVVLAPLPMYGGNDLKIGISPNDQLEILEWNNELAGNIIPTFDDIILRDTLRYDDTTGHVSFVQLHTTMDSWVYAGLHRGNQLTMLVAFNPYGSPYFDHLGGQSTPARFMETSLLDLAGVCSFVRQ